MSKKIWLLCIGFFGAFAPIGIAILCLITSMGVDFLVKLFTLKKICRDTGRSWREVYISRVARVGYIYKSAGYFLIAGAFFPIDYFYLTPFAVNILSIFTEYSSYITTQALFTNMLLIIFCLIEVSSINENWVDITGNNILNEVFKMVKKVRGSIASTSEFIKNTKENLK